MKTAGTSGGHATTSSRDRGLRARAALWLLGLAPIVVFGVLPIVALAWRFHGSNESTGSTGDIGLLGDSGVLTNSFGGDRLLRTLALAGIAATVATLLGAPIGLLLAKRRGTPFDALRLVLALPLLLPSVQLAAGWSLVLRPDGIVSRALAAILGTATTSPIEAVESLAGAGIVLGLQSFPIAAWLVDAAIAAVPHASLDAARALGATELAAFRVACGGPFSRAIAAAFLFAFVLAAGDCGVPVLFGVDVLGLEVLTRLAAFPDFGAALAAALPLAFLGVIAALLLDGLVHSSAIGRGRSAGDVVRAYESTPRSSLRAILADAKHRRVLVALALAVALLIAPPFVVWLAATRDGDLSVAASLASRPLRSTLASAGIAALGATLAAVAITARPRSDGGLGAGVARAIDLLGVATLAIPSALLGLGVIASGVLPAEGLVPLAGILVARHVCVAARIVGPAFQRLPREGIDAAASLGGGSFTVATRVVAPAVAPALLAALATCFALAAQDLGATSLLHRPGEETLPVALLSIEANAPRGVVAAFCLTSALVVVPIGAAGVLAALLAGRRSRRNSLPV